MTNEKNLKKDIGLITLITLGVGSMIGSGIFGLPAAMSAVSGPSLILAIFLAGVVTFLLAIAYAELGSAFPITGGPYSIPRLAIGDVGGFVMGWGYFIYLFIGTAAIVDIFVVYLNFYFDGLANGQTLTPTGIIVAIAVLWTLTLINIIGVKWGGLFSVITTVGKLVPLLIFCFVGITSINAPNFVPFFPFGFSGVTLAITMFFWAYTGFEAVVVPSEEIKNPSRTIPLAMFLTMLITITVYVLVGTSLVGIIHWNSLGLAPHDWDAIGKLSSPLSDLAAGVSMPVLAIIIMIGAIISTAGTSGNFVLLQGRMPFAMAQDKLFCSKMAKVHPKFGTPAVSLAFASILTTIVMIAIPNFPSVALIASITALIPYAAAALTVPILRKTRPDVPRPFKLPFHTFITLIGFILATLLIYWACWPWTLVGAILLLAGYPAFLFVRRSNFELKRNSWIIVYIVGIVVMSLIGDPRFEFNNFTPWKPLGLLTMPADSVILSIFAVIIFAWAYKANTSALDTPSPMPAS